MNAILNLIGIDKVILFILGWIADINKDHFDYAKSTVLDVESHGNGLQGEDKRLSAIKAIQDRFPDLKRSITSLLIELALSYLKRKGWIK